MTLQKDQIFYGDVQVRQDANGFISLNDMWIAAGLPDGKDPRQWSRKPKDKKSGSTGTISISGGPGYEFIEFIAKKLNVGAGHIYKTQRGKHGGGTWAHWQIALAYAKYLSPEFHAWANQVIKDRIEEDHNPELGIERSRDRAIKSWRKQGKDDKFIQTRIKGIDARNVFTDTLSEHGVSGMGYANCTNNIYTPILGGKAGDIKKQKGLSDNANLRDSMSTVELAGVMFAEILASDKIEREERQGNNSCASACLGAAMNIKTVIDKHETALEKPIPKPAITGIPIGDRLNSLRDRLR